MRTSSQQPAKWTLSARSRGYLLAIVGVMVVTPDSLLLRYAKGYTEELPGTIWAIVMVKCSFGSAFYLISAIALHYNARGSVRASDLVQQFTAGPWHITVASICQAGVSIGFPLSLIETTAAKALLLISLNPLWSAILGRLLLGDKLHPITICATLLGIVSVIIVFAPVLVSGGSATSGSIHGDFISLGTGCLLASYITANRWGAQRRPKASMSYGSFLGSSLGALIVLPLAVADPAVLRGCKPGFYAMMLADTAVVATVTIMALVLAPRYISGTEVALVLLLENVFGPLWVFLSPDFREVPTAFTFAGGALLLGTLAMHEFYFLMQQKRKQRTKPPSQIVDVTCVDK